MNLSRITLAVRVFVVVVLFVNKSCLGTFPVSRWSKNCWKNTKSVYVARALYCLPLDQWEPLRIVEKWTKTSFVARGTPAQRSPLVTLHRARRLTGAFHKFFRIFKKPFRGEAILTEIFFTKVSRVPMSKLWKVGALFSWTSEASHYTAMNYVKLKVLEAG